jgi:galactofuranosylgalactofuranosylrhamnosyl-N-acetylglucosaminyl-diphospho-decaprenol beta-1,5/1,6-galactofuranosyltransferase
VTASTTETLPDLETTSRLLQRQIMPPGRDLDVLSLYVDPGPVALDADRYGVTMSREHMRLLDFSMQQTLPDIPVTHPDQIEDRHRFRIPKGNRVSFGTYFNAFPAAYWRRWTVVSEVTLSVTVEGAGAQVIVYKSMAGGRAQRVDAVATEGGEPETFAFELSLKPFVDGGWYWYDVVAGDEDVVVAGAEWAAEVPVDRAQHGTTTVGITTMNRPDFCANLLLQLAEEDLRPYLDEVIVVEQGTKKVVDSEVYPEAEAALGGLLRLIEQANLGGSGGYARGQLETLRRGTATYFMCMDDDVVCEPEGIIRAVTFGDLARRPTIVGGHMFNLYAKSRLHSFGEIVQPWRFWWQSAPGVFNDWDFDVRNLRSARWMHRRVDVDFNGWFMCMIPLSVLDELGLSLPIFIKWDDSEYGLRAKDAGYPTVTFPGAAVWHIPWTDKNDALDWQSYFHQRNRFIAALLHSPYERGGRMVRESLNHQVKHLVCMQYSTVEMRHQALEDVLAGPHRLHETLGTKLPEIRSMTKSFSDAQLQADPDAFPPVRRTKPPRKGRDDAVLPGRFGMLLTAGLAPLRQLRRVRPLARRYPEAEVKAMDAKWPLLARYDAAIVSLPDGTSAAMYKRDPERYRDLLRRTLEIHQRLAREWPRLAKEYRGALEEITAPDAWEATFKSTAEDGS